MPHTWLSLQMWTKPREEQLGLGHQDKLSAEQAKLALGPRLPPGPGLSAPASLPGLLLIFPPLTIFLE